MEQSKNAAILEISSTAAKFAIGTVVSDKPCLIYYDECPIRGCLKDGLITDSATISKAVSSFLSVIDESLRLRVNASTVSVILPPLGLKIYQSNKRTNVVSQAVDAIDITNVMSLVKKDPIPSGNYIVDIIPDYFAIDSNKCYANPPLGEKSDNLTVCAKIHTLPESIVKSYRNSVENAHFSISRMAVAPYCASQLIATDKSLPTSYLLIDMGARLTSVSLVGSSSLFASLSFPKGGDDLTEAIASAFSIPFDKAEELKKNYGYDTRKLAYKLPLATSQDEMGKKISFYQEDLNNVIVSYLEGYDSLLLNAINQTLESQRNPSNSEILSKFPLIFTGGASQLFGLPSLLLSGRMDAHQVIFFSPKIVGARNASLTNIMGLLAAQGQLKGSLEENYRGVAGLSRVSK
jgi:cell division protein FtsA